MRRCPRCEKGRMFWDALERAWVCLQCAARQEEQPSCWQYALTSQAVEVKR